MVWDGNNSAFENAMPYLAADTPRRQTANDNSIPNGGVDTFIRWTNTVEADATGVITNPNTALNSDGRIVLGSDGIFQIVARYSHGNGTNGSRRMRIHLNGVGTVLAIDVASWSPANGASVQITYTDRFASGDYILTSVSHNDSGGALAAFSSIAEYANISVVRLSP